MIRALAASAADVVSVHLHATSVETYQAVMGVDGYREALMNVQAFVMERATRRSLLPILAPLFFKCGENLAKMEAFYDQWLRAVGVAVLDGPSDFAGQIPDRGAVDMCPPRRRPCADCQPAHRTERRAVRLVRAGRFGHGGRRLGLDEPSCRYLGRAGRTASSKP